MRALKPARVAAVEIAAGGVAQEEADVERGLDLVLDVVEEVAVGEDVLVEVELEVLVGAGGHAPELLGPDELVGGDGEEGVAALGNLGVGALADLVGGAEAAVAAAAEHDAGAGAVAEVFVGDVDGHGLLEEGVPVVPDAGELGEELALVTALVALEEGAALGIAVDVHIGRDLLVGDEDADADEGLGVVALGQDGHDLVAAAELLIPDADVGGGGVAAEQGAFAEALVVLPELDVVAGEELAEVEDGAELVGCPGGLLRGVVELAGGALFVEEEGALGACLLVGDEGPAEELGAEGGDGLPGGIAGGVEEVLAREVGAGDPGAGAPQLLIGGGGDGARGDGGEVADEGGDAGDGAAVRGDEDDGAAVGGAFLEDGGGDAVHVDDGEEGSSRRWRRRARGCGRLRRRRDGRCRRRWR